MKLKTILVLVELEDGSVHQVLCSQIIKDLCIDLMTTETGTLRLSERIEPITIETYQK